MIKKKAIRVDGKKIAYVDEGKGQTLFFIHGNPTSSYLWRNIINHLKLNFRCIAPDLIGMGDSEKLDNISLESYSFFEHKEWLNKFIKKINLEEKIYFIVHDWGSALGFDFTRENKEMVSGIAYMEAIVCPLTWNDWPEDAKNIFQLLRSEVGVDLIHNKNVFIERILPSSILRKLSFEEMENYRKPFLKKGYDRQPTLSWPRQIPFEGEPSRVNKVVKDYSEFMKDSNMRKLFINAIPGSILVGRQRDFCRTWNNQKEVSVKGLHFLQEDSPNEIANEIGMWIHN
tara:strand:- start:429 stop:1286 length:858 start_codon:yes stop_codon:yes gene_type:complete